MNISSPSAPDLKKNTVDPLIYTTLKQFDTLIKSITHAFSLCLYTILQSIYDSLAGLLCTILSGCQNPFYSTWHESFKLSQTWWLYSPIEHVQQQLHIKHEILMEAGEVFHFMLLLQIIVCLFVTMPNPFDTKDGQKIVWQDWYCALKQSTWFFEHEPMARLGVNVQIADGVIRLSNEMWSNEMSIFINSDTV